jgi:hypothetical protein
MRGQTAEIYERAEIICEHEDFGVSVDRWIHQIKGGSNIPKVDPPEIHKNEQMKSKALCERG